MKNNDPKRIIILQASMYLAGIIGLSIPITQALFQFLTPFHLMSSFVFLILFQTERNKSFWLFTFFVILFGYFIELLGVKTGKIFGEYHYESTLGFKLFDIPPMIGINWFLMVYGVGIFLEKKLGMITNAIIKSAIGGLLLCFLDYLIEPVAISQKMWVWHQNHVPLQNYLAWFFVAFVMLLVFNLSNFKKNNPIASALFIFQVIFFAVLRFMIYFEGLNP